LKPPPAIESCQWNFHNFCEYSPAFSKLKEAESMKHEARSEKREAGSEKQEAGSMEREAQDGILWAETP
jgi:hypothetical protein